MEMCQFGDFKGVGHFEAKLDGEKNWERKKDRKKNAW